MLKDPHRVPNQIPPVLIYLFTNVVLGISISRVPGVIPNGTTVGAGTLVVVNSPTVPPGHGPFWHHNLQVKNHKGSHIRTLSYVKNY